MKRQPYIEVVGLYITIFYAGALACQLVNAATRRRYRRLSCGDSRRLTTDRSSERAGEVHCHSKHRQREDLGLTTSSAIRVVKSPAEQLTTYLPAVWTTKAVNHYDSEHERPYDQCTGELVTLRHVT